MQEDLTRQPLLNPVAILALPNSLPMRCELSRPPARPSNIWVLKTTCLLLIVTLLQPVVHYRSQWLARHG